MWQRKRSPRHYVRIGRHAIERWVDRSSGLECVDLRTLPEGGMPPTTADIDTGLRAILQDPTRTRVTLLLESALMPALLIEAGADLWRPTQIQSLLRHRLDALYTQPGKQAHAWETRVDFAAGEPAALGFGLPATLKDTLGQACASARVDCRGMLPALAWGLDRLGATRQLRAPQGWLGWAEQDRLLLVNFRRNRVTELNAAAVRIADSTAIQRQVAGECVRRGFSHEGVVVATRWDAHSVNEVPSGTDSVTWVDIGRPYAHTANHVQARGQS